VTRFLRWLERLTCPHDVYIISPDSPLWKQCAVCKKPKRI
jgi:hypothetical protein